ncbi:hypothetical protein [Streptomyces europaeiscabiei]|uniref:hypothetical protein n=1 Tax=Streptomyces europaeiscabiei TaxID=146819 RepID=UPI0029BC2C46|nr:hypothetical protein [Streptomyces europaeiscabiei]MDX3777659.1 hypothetical protein [Streptomyces europaeiscabiei]
MSTHGKDEGPDRRDGRDELHARRRASWGRRDDDERAEERGDERAEQREPDERVGGRGLETHEQHAEHEETQSHAGNGTVNHGPEEQGPHPKGRHLEGRTPDDSRPDGPRSEDSPSGGLPSDDLSLDDSPSGESRSGEARSADLNSADLDPDADASGEDDPVADAPSPDAPSPGSSTSGSSSSGSSSSDSSGTTEPDVDEPRFGALRSADLWSGGVGSGGSGSNGSGPKGTGGFEPDDELVLRNLLQHAVSEIEPRDGTLEHLRRAVPARRARKRQAVVGMAAAALFIGTAIPALVHVSNSTGSDLNTSNMGNGSQTQGSGGQSKGQTGGHDSSGGSSGGSKNSGKDSSKDKGDKGKGENKGSTGGAQPTPTTDVSTLCTSAQLGGGASVGAPDSSGSVYGTFRVSNISGTSCTVSGAGGVITTPQGAADGAKITVANHVAGDAAVGLPDPSLSLPQAMLAPGAAYEVKFAWVPSEPCPTTSGGTTDGGGTGGTDPSTDPTPTGEATPGTTTDGSNSVSTQLFTEDGVVDGSVLVSHIAEGGIATFTTAVSNACAGVVYRTGLLTAV